MVFTLYLVMCLEYILRTSGILKIFTLAAGNLFHDNRIVLGFMPAFLGFLPSLGGAIFSAPLVQEAAEPYQLSPEKKTAINYWFRHVWEFSNPILPSMLLAASFTGDPHRSDRQPSVCFVLRRNFYRHSCPDAGSGVPDR